MEVKFIERGKYKGNIDVPGTLRTMRVADKWAVEPSVVNIRSIRNICSKMRASGFSFSVHVPSYSEPNITVIRNCVTNR